MTGEQPIAAEPEAPKAERQSERRGVCDVAPLSFVAG
jgi:hypothetical protein